LESGLAKLAIDSIKQTINDTRQNLSADEEQGSADGWSRSGDTSHQGGGRLLLDHGALAFTADEALFSHRENSSFRTGIRACLTQSA
jgi:hypothetical protein